MYELPARETIMAFTVVGSLLALSIGMFTWRAPNMLTLWINRAGPTMGWLLLVCSAGLVATKLGLPGLPGFRQALAALVVVLTFTQVITLWWVCIASLAVADELDAEVRGGRSAVLAFTLGTSVVFFLCSVYAGMYET